MAIEAQTVVFLHGIGAGPASWDAQRAALPDGFTGVAPQIAGLTGAGAGTFTLSTAAAAIRAELDEHGIDRVHLCGLSVGGMVGTRFVLDDPERVVSLVLSGSQVRPNPALMSVQSAIMRLLPSRLVAPAGMTKAGMLAVLGAVAKADFREELSEIDVPTLVLCGMQDRPNLPAARLLASGIANAELQLVPGAGHEWNTEHPREFSARLNTFYSRFRAA